MLFRILVTLVIMQHTFLAAYTGSNMSNQSFAQFLEEFIPSVQKKSSQLTKLFWILETTGSSDAAELVAEMDTEMRLLFADKNTYNRLLEWKNQEIDDPELKRELDLLIFAFKQNMIPKELMEKIAVKESQITQAYNTFRATYNGEKLSENEIKERLSKENDPIKRKEIWEVSKQIGDLLAPLVLDVVKLRNQAAKFLGYENYFAMQLEMQEVDKGWLMDTFVDLSNRSDDAYNKLIEKINQKLAAKFQVSMDEIGPWAWNDPFCQEDPLADGQGDTLFQQEKMIPMAKEYYKQMGFDISSIIAKSDMYEKEGKCPHAFCINMDRDKDVRTLNNLKPSLRWMDTLLHELGHAVYEYGYSPSLPWLLREPPHMIPTEAMALLNGRQAYKLQFFSSFSSLADEQRKIAEKVKKSSDRRQLICSRWILVMTAFEEELYKNPDQDLNRLWWDCVAHYQKVHVVGREGKNDWATKYHIALAPVYYYSYLLGELFASSLQKHAYNYSDQGNIWHPKMGEFLKNRLFSLGNTKKWDELIEHVLGKPLSSEDWLEEFAQK